MSGIERNHRDGNRQCPSTCPNPRGRVVTCGGSVERLHRLPALIAGKPHPDEREVSGRVARGEVAEIDNRGDPSLIDQDVSGMEVSVNPRRLTTPLTGSEHPIPRGTRALLIDATTHRVEMFTKSRRPIGEGYAAPLALRRVGRSRNVERAKEVSDLGR